MVSKENIFYLQENHYLSFYKNQHTHKIASVRGTQDH